ncbi:MAG: hypothetical protein OSJ70_03230 [Bacilli bacterium]|nr:hypothetical protein [Bacilli bacterium]
MEPVSNDKLYEDYLDHNLFYTKSEFLSEYGDSYNVYANNTLIMKDEELFKKYKESELMHFRTQMGYSTVSKNLLLDLLTKEGLSQYLLMHMNDDQGIVIRMSLVKDGEIKDYLAITRATLAKAIGDFSKEISVKIPNKVQMRMALLTNLSTVYSLKQNYANEIHSCVVDGDICEISCLDLYDILNRNDEEYKKFLEEDKDMTFIVNGEEKTYPKRVVTYMLINFIEQQRILEKYLLPEIALKRYIELHSYTQIDYESINKYEKTNDDYDNGISISEMINLDENLENAVLEGMNPTYSLLEKAIYIYYKLCELLSYDQEYYAANQKGNEAERHCDINRINSINLENNEVVCYEFIAIYSYFLRKLGIKYTVDNAVQDEYGKGHSTISFKVGEYLITADSTRSILSNDMTSAKIGAPLIGMRLTNKNYATRNKFLETYNKVMEDIQNTKKNKKIFADTLREYREKYAKKHLNKKEKLYLLFKEIGETKLKGIDVISVHMRIYEQMFKNDEDIDINFISSTVNAYKDYNYTPLTILSVRIAPDDYIYYQIDPNNPNLVETISKEEIEELFESRDFAYLGRKNKEIPGINLGSRENYVR